MKQKFSIDAGVVNGARQVPSPNFNDRPENETVSLLVLHNISLPPGQFGGGYVERFFQNQLPVNEHPYFAEIKDLQVSAHLLVERDGAVTQFVNLNARAWHAGLSQFDGRNQCNDFSIGIELEGTDDKPFTDTQYAVLAELTEVIQLAYPEIKNDRIAGHSDIAPGRKTDPGPCFDWSRFRRNVESDH